MAYQIVATTAENVIGAVDACGQSPEGQNKSFVAAFLDILESQAENALIMTEQLALCSVVNGKHIPTAPFSTYLMTASAQQRSIIFRMVVEQYQPFQTFKQRLKMTGLVPKAAEQTKVCHGVTTHRDDIVQTFTNFGQYTGSLVFEGAGLYKVSEEQLSIATLTSIIIAQATARTWVASRLGQDACTFVQPVEVLGELVLAANSLDRDQRGSIVHAGNAVESFLVQIAGKYSIDLTSANGINAKAVKIHNEHKINTKLINMSKYLGHIRNASDHGNDSEIGAMWTISDECAVEYVNVAITFIRAVVNFENGIFCI
jgi:hypothetical protein